MIFILNTGILCRSLSDKYIYINAKYDKDNKSNNVCGGVKLFSFQNGVMEIVDLVIFAWFFFFNIMKETLMVVGPLH